MCGIIGYIGKKNAIPILVNGLRRMEYRGYDSFGFSIADGEGVFTFKKVGKISDFDSSLLGLKGKGQTGIAHTRWGTHGEITEKNPHPHWGSKKNIFVVHNGIIENYQQLKEELEKEGCKFASQTDTEVLAHLIEKYFQGNLEEAVRKALKKVQGTYGIAVIARDDPQKIVVARLSSPLLIGTNDGEYIIASDPNAILPFTKKVINMEDNEIATITPDNFFIMKEREPETLEEGEAEVQTRPPHHRAPLPRSLQSG